MGFNSAFKGLNRSYVLSRQPTNLRRFPAGVKNYSVHKQDKMQWRQFESQPLVTMFG